jgi:hypothetical protein
VEENVIKKPKTVANLLTIADTCIEASEVRARLLESHGKGTTKKMQDNQKVNMTDRGDCGDRSFHALAPSLRQVVWPDKLKDGHIDKYDGSSNSEEFIQVYHIVFEAT